MRPTRDTNGISTTWAVIYKRPFLQKCFVEHNLLTAVKSAILSHVQFSYTFPLHVRACNICTRACNLHVHMCMYLFLCTHNETALRV